MALQSCKAFRLCIAALLLAASFSAAAVPQSSDAKGLGCREAASVPKAVWPPDEINSVCFISREMGWLSGYTPSHSLYVTTDGGRTWRRSLAVDGIWTWTLTPVFRNARSGWAYGWSLWRTTDGGAHWRKCRVSTPRVKNPFVYDVQVVSPGVLWAQASYDPESQIQTVLRSTNGGKSWRSRRSYRVWGPLVAVTSTRAVLAPSPGRAVLLTTNAGATWRRVWRSPGAVDGGARVSSRKAWLWGSWGIARTLNGGVRWSVVSRSVTPRVAAFVGEKAGWAFGYDGDAWRTVNGRDWKRVVVPWGDGVASVSFINRSTGFVVEDGRRLWRTMDGGLTWAKLLETPGLW